MCSIRALAKNHGDPYYEPTIVVHDRNCDKILWICKYFDITVGSIVLYIKR